ncbi:MAG: TRAP transporter substrate-binding protein DctP [Pseudomonadota bacterium]
MPLCIKNIRQMFLILIFLTATDTAWAVNLKIATLSPQGSMWMVKMQEGAEEVVQKTNNRVTFKFYPGGVMGEDETVLKLIRAGQLHGGAMVGGSLARFFPANQIYAQPLKFSQIEEVDYVRKYMDQYIENGHNENGFVTFGLMGAGFAYIMSQNPVETVEDLRTQKVWVLPDNKSSQESLQAFGVTPIPLSLSDVLTGLQTGLINTVATSPVGAITLQWHDQIKYVTNLPLIYIYGVLAVDKKRFQKISKEDRQIVHQVMTEACRQIDIKNRQDNIKATETLKKRGITFISPSKKALTDWLELGKQASQRMVESGALPKDVVEQLDNLLANFHSNQ